MVLEEVNGIHFGAKEEGDAENMRQRLLAIHGRPGLRKCSLKKIILIIILRGVFEEPFAPTGLWRLKNKNKILLGIYLLAVAHPAVSAHV